MENGAIFYKVRIDIRPRIPIEKIPVIGQAITAIINCFESNWQTTERETLYPESLASAKQVYQAEKVNTDLDTQNIHRVRIVSY